MRKKLALSTASFAFALGIGVAGGGMAAPPVAKEETLSRVQYWQGELAALRVSIAISFDWSGMEGVETLNNEPVERDQKAAGFVDRVGSAFRRLAQEPEIRTVLASDVRKIQIRHDPKLEADPAVSVNQGIATVRFNYGKFKFSNYSPEMHDLVYQALPSAANAELRQQRKKIEETLVQKEKWFRNDKMVDLSFDVRWKELAGKKLPVWKGIERMIDDVTYQLSFVCGFSSSKPVLKEKVKTVSFGLLTEPNPPPVRVLLTGTTLSVAMREDILSNAFSTMDTRDEIAKVLEIKEFVNR